MKTQNITRRSFIFYISIFVLMLFMESQRFSVFFERESSKIPQLNIVSEYVEKISNIQGIIFVNQTLDQIAKDFSQEYIIDSKRSINDQFMGFIEQYTQYDFSQLGKYANKLDSSDAHVVADANNLENIKLGQQDTNSELFSEKELANKKINNKIPLQETGKVTQANILQGSEDKTEKGGHLLDYSFIEAALLDKNMTVEVLARLNQNYQEKSVENDFSLGIVDFFLKRQNLGFYNPRNSSPAPTPMALREYESSLPDYGKKMKVLIVGDSMMMEGLGPTLHAALRKRSDLSVVREGRYSSGLSRPDFFNWPENMVKLIAKHNPNLVIVSMGANDTQDIVINKKRHFIDSDSWKRVYEIRTYGYLNLVAAEKRHVLWVSLPVMGIEPYFSRTKRISKIQAQVSSYFDNVNYINIEHLLTKNDRFVSFVKGKDNRSIRIRQKDHIHVSKEGGQILTNHLLPQVQESIENIRYDEVDKSPFPPVSGQANRVVLSSEFRKKATEYYIYIPRALEENKNILDSVDFSKQNSAKQNTVAQGSANKSAKKSFNNSAQGEKNNKLVSIPALIQTNMKTGDERFPVLYLLHGAYGNGQSWNEFMGKKLQKIADEKRVIIVAPSSEPFGWYLDSPLVAQNQIESYFVKELIPHIDMLYPTTKKRAIAGLSMGGHGAMLLGFKYPQVFSSVASASGVLDIRLHPEQWKMKDLLGNLDTNKQNWDKNSVAAHIAKKQVKKAPQQILIVTGTEDFLVLEDNRLANQLLEQHGFKYEYEEFPGAHDGKFWDAYIPGQLRKQADYLHNLTKN